VFQTEDDPEPSFTYRVDGTGLFTVDPFGNVVLTSDSLDFEETPRVQFQVSSKPFAKKDPESELFKIFAVRSVASSWPTIC